jgi:asparagine synthase (glutamine-hydrolysing)
VQYLRWHGRIPRPGVRTLRAERGGTYRGTVEVPRWIDPDFAARVRLRERVDGWNGRKPPPHTLRPEAAEQLAGTLWPYIFNSWDPGYTGVPIELRHPYFDLRLVRLALSIPPAQWYNDKGLLRIAMRGRLPAPILARPKTPVWGDPLAVRAAALGAGWLGGRTAGPAVSPWVDLSRLPRLTGGASDEVPRDFSADFRPLALSLWLAQHPLAVVPEAF